MTNAQKKFDAIKRVLTGEIDALTGRELFNGMTSGEQRLFTGGVDGVNKELGYLKKKLLVENGLSVIVNGRTQLAWKISKLAENAEPVQVDELPASTTDDGCLVLLSPNVAVEAALIEIITTLKDAQTKQSIVIERKEQKIDTLSRLGALMSDDIKAIFDDIVADIKKCEAA